MNITGLSVDFNHLQKAEGAWRVECDNALVNAPRMPEFARRALLSGTRRVTKPYAPDRVTLEILPERLKQVTFAWIDLFNDDLAPQLGSQNDLVISENALYIYDNICFPPLRPAIDRLVNSLGPGGLLVLDSNIAAVIKIIDTSRYLPLPQSLYFSHPKLIELPLPQDYRYASHVHLLTSQMIDEFAARPELDDDEDMIFRYSKWLHEKGYGPEIDARGGRQPSGLYRKIDQTI
ncbi:MAG: hypothetical protein DCC75_08870 [Proteobacteria bacterium]|nr:MAG: hypothetical protein DCC75_08870 [Pseudomonadota bacterium]